MHYVNEQITKTFEHLLNLRTKYHSLDTLMTSPKTTRIFCRINHEKLVKYRNENDSISNKNSLLIDKKENDLIPTIKVLSKKIIHRMTIGTQTTFTQQSNFIDSFLNTSSIISKATSESDVSTDNSSSSSSFSKTNASILISDLSNESIERVQSYPFNHSFSNIPSTNGRAYIRSFVRDMLGDDDLSEMEEE